MIQVPSVRVIRRPVLNSTSLAASLASLITPSQIQTQYNSKRELLLRFAGKTEPWKCSHTDLLFQMNSNKSKIIIFPELTFLSVFFLSIPQIF